ncbi:MAG: flagellar biosynthetic protein FliO [Bacteriovorax sp.]|nr:flagellar biosynthetic protein FliO [Bacteriovorax sp.]
MKKLTLRQLAFLLLLTSFGAIASEVNIKGVELTSDKALTSRLSIKLVGNLNDNPLISVNDKTLQIIIPNAHVNTKIERKFHETTVTATQADRDSVSIRAVLPYSLQGKESLVNITLKDGSVDVSFPRVAASKVSRSPGLVAPAANAKAIEANNAEAEKLDENYLSSLVKENEKLAATQHPEATKANMLKKDTQADTAQAGDRVNLAQSGIQKDSAKSVFNKEEPVKSSFSLTSYIGKFVAFLSLMVLGFYGVLTLFKKGVIKKGKLGFLHSTKLVEVLSTTHVAPKRTLMMVKAHKQIFLISNSETGMQLISEINDVTGLIKTGEEELTGSNFDTNLFKASRKEKEFKLKEDSVANDYSLDDMLNDNEGVGVDKTETHALKSIAKNPVKDQVRFSDQIKTKLKNMKQIQ